jgi:hypothetical protein
MKSIGMWVGNIELKFMFLGLNYDNPVEADRLVRQVPDAWF